MPISLNSVLERYAGVPVLVLGSSGFIGRWVTSRLAQAGAELYLPARDCAGATRTLAEYGVHGNLFKVDLSDTDVVCRLTQEISPTITFNLAGYGIDRSERSEELAYRLNAQLPEMICGVVAATHGIESWRGQRFVHVGTAMEYGDITGDLQENCKTRPTTLYGKSKLAGTEAVTSSCKRNLLAGVTARLFAVYGPGESDERLLPTLVTASKQTGPVDLTAGLHKRDFTYIEDVAEALLRLGISECRSGEVVNVATGSLTSVRAFVQTAAECLGIPKSRLHFGALATRPEEMNHDPVNIDRLSKLTGWKPETNLADGIRRSSSYARLHGDVESATKSRQTVCELF